MPQAPQREGKRSFLTLAPPSRKAREAAAVRFFLNSERQEMSDNKSWERGPRRSFGDDGERRGRFDRFDRFDRGERSDRSDRREFGDRKPFGERREFGDRPRFDRNDRSDRFERSDRREFGDRKPFGDRDRKPFGERREFGDRPRFDRKPSGRRFEGGRREDFGVRSGPRARAYDARRFAERSDFARNAMVKIDSDIADFFGSPEAVNQALRLLVDAARVVKLDAVKPAEDLEPKTAAQIFGGDVEDDDVEDAEYGAAAQDDDVDEADAADESEAADEEADEAEKAGESKPASK